MLEVVGTFSPRARDARNIVLEMSRKALDNRERPFLLSIGARVVARDARFVGSHMDPLVGATPITIVVAVGVRLYREGLAAALGAHTHLHIVGTAGTTVDVEATVRELHPAIVIVDVTFDDVFGLMRTLRAEGHRSRIVAFAVREDIGTILDYAEAGADGFVTATSSVAEVVEAIERTAAGELLCSPRIAAQLLRRASHQLQSEESSGSQLTHREHEVLSLLKQGRSNKEIGNALNIAEATVKNHVHHVLEKLQVATRGQAAASVVGRPIKAGLRRPSASRAS